MELKVDLHRFGGPRPLAVVCGHERSGNHFLMNAIAACCGYSTVPYLDFDHTEININFHQADLVANVLNVLAAEHTANVVKSHHEAAFFAPALTELAGDVRIIYIHRQPVAVMESFWKFIQGWPWAEGPRTSSATAFAQATPSGRMMRYQMGQHGHLIERWERHVLDWHDLAASHDQVVTVRYEGLRDNYAGTMVDVCTALDCPVREFPKPDREDFVKAVDADAYVVTDRDREALTRFIDETVSTETKSLLAK